MNPAAQIFQLDSIPRKKPRKRKRQPAVWKAFRRGFLSLLSWLRAQKLSRPERKLRLDETVALGEKRFAAVLEYDGQKFLIAGAAQSVHLLTKLPKSKFSRTLKSKRMESAGSRECEFDPS